MLPQSQFILLVILIVLALVLLNWEAKNAVVNLEDSADDGARLEAGLTKTDQS
jgi:hypothetical protein